MNKPFTILIIPLVIGILVSYYFIINTYFIFILLIFTILTLVYNIIKNGLNQRVIIILFLLLGIFIGNDSKNSNLINYIDKRADFIGIVESIIKKEEGFSRIIISVDYIDNNKLPKEKIVLNINGDIDFIIGERVLFNGELNRPKENTNPKLFNYRLNLMTENIYTTTNIKDYAINSLGKDYIPIKYQIKSVFINLITDTFNTYLSENNANLMTSIFLGHSSYLNSEDIDIYRDMGLAHLLAVSGLHIGIISGFIFFVLSNLCIKRKYNIMITLSIIWIYGYLIGFPPSILRSSIMFSMLYYSQLIHEPYDFINSISFAMFLLLLINPYYLYNIGFQLSFAATFSIIAFTPKIKDLFYPYNNQITQSISSILGVQIGLLPFQAYYFNNINILSILANLSIIPIISFALVVGFAMIIFSCFSFLAPLNLLFGYLLETILNFEAIILKWLISIPISTIKIFSPEIISIVLFYLMLFVVFKMIDLKKFSKYIIKTTVIYLIFLSFFNIHYISNYDFVELHFMDVGQGDSILIRTKNKDYLMDTGGSLFGNYNITEGITLPYLEKLGVRRLEGLFITHFDADHSQGTTTILDNIKTKYMFYTYPPDNMKIIDSIQANKVNPIILRENICLKLDLDVELDIIWPMDNLKMDANNSSLVAVLRTKGTNILLTGDMEKEAEYFIKDKIVTSIDIIKVPHHGSKTSSTEELLQYIKPKDAVISVGRNNLYNHPSPEIIDRYTDLGTNIYRTDQMGLIKIIIHGKGYDIKPYLVHGERNKSKFTTYFLENINCLVTYTLFFMLIYIMVKISSYEGDDLHEL